MPLITTEIVSPATVLSIHDGDTFSAAITGHRTFVGAIRLEKVFALELATEGGQKARDHLARLMPPAKRIRLSISYTHEGHAIESLCRPLAIVWIESTGVNVNETHTEWLKANGCWGGNQ